MRPELCWCNTQPTDRTSDRSRSGRTFHLPFGPFRTVPLSPCRAGGALIGRDDLTISRRALRVLREGRNTTIENLSRHAAIEIHGPGAMRLLHPGERLRLVGDTRLVISGESHQFPIEITGVRSPPRARRSASGAMSRPLVESFEEIAAARKISLIALCLARFDPRRWPDGLLSAREIANQLRLAGTTVTPKEINNKLARLRVQISRQHNVQLGSREELADFAVRHGVVTSRDVAKLRSLQNRQARTTDKHG